MIRQAQLKGGHGHLLKKQPIACLMRARLCFFRDPIFICLLLSLAVFVLDRWLDRDGDREIYVGVSDVARLHAQWTAQGGRAASRQELEGLVDGHVREEILSREAKALGLDRGDVIIRRSLVQKLQFVTEDTALETPTSEEELETYLRVKRPRYTVPVRLSFSHVYFSADRHADAESLARGALSQLLEAGGEGWTELGIRFC